MNKVGKERLAHDILEKMTATGVGVYCPYLEKTKNPISQQRDPPNPLNQYISLFLNVRLSSFAQNQISLTLALLLTFVM